jgi:membrane protein YdbS with pleckstrin-like domain
MTAQDTTQTLEDTVRFKAHWTLFLPALVVALLYGGLWLFLLASGKGDTALARLMLLVLLLIVPVLLVRAYLRFASFGLLIRRQAIIYRRGWLRPRWRRVKLDSLSGVRPVLSPLGRLFGGGALVLTRLDHGDIRLYDVERPEEAARLISRRLRIVQARLKPI